MKNDNVIEGNQHLKRKGKGYDFLLEEYRYFSDWFKRSEELGEKKLNYLFTLVTAVLAVIITLITSTAESPEILLRFIPIIIALLLSLLILGILTFGRIIKRNNDSDNYKKDIDNIRTIFKKNFKKELADYELFYKIKGRKILTGGILDVIISLNSFIFSILILIGTYSFPIILNILFLSVSFIASFILLQIIALIQYYNNYNKVMGIDRPIKLLLKKQIISLILVGICTILIGIFTISFYFTKAIPKISLFFEYIVIILSCLSIFIWIISFWSVRTRYYNLTERKKQIKKNWEWRIFFKEETSFDLWKELKGIDKNIKSLLESELQIEFQDNYFNLKNTKYGLKERLNQKEGQLLPKIELKVKIKEKKDDIKAELWDKILSIKDRKPLSPNENLDKNQLLKLLQKRLYKSGLEDLSHIEKVISKVKSLKELERTFIVKERTQIRAKYNRIHKKKWEFYHGYDQKRAPLENPRVILIEQTKILCLKTNNETINNIRTICLETKKNVKLIKKFKNKFININTFEEKNYPQYIRELK